MMDRVSVLALLGILGSGLAHGQPAGAPDVAAADTLFLEAKQLAVEGRFAEACPRFEASMAVLPQLGVQLNLADCYEHVGKMASAWLAFGEAAALARHAGDRRELFARQRQDALVPRLYRIRITVSGRPPQGLTVTRDGVRVAPSAYGVEVPVDPGSHTVQAAAPGRAVWSTRLVVSGDNPRVAVEIPELQPGSAPPGTASAVDAGRRVTPAIWVSGGVATAAIGLGAGMGFAARSLLQESRAGCTPSNVCTDSAYALIERSRRDGNISTAAFAIGGAALVVGVILYLRSPGERDRPVTLAPAITAGAAGVTIAGVF
jgi:hypothetical protein